VGIVAFYSIVHLDPRELEGVLREFRRVVVADGLVLIWLSKAHSMNDRGR